MTEYKELSELTHRTAITGDERMPVSSDEYVTAKDIAALLIKDAVAEAKVNSEILIHKTYQGALTYADKMARTAAAWANEYTDEQIDPINDAFPVLAHSDCTLEQRISHLEQQLADALSGKMYIPALKVRDFEAWGEVLNIRTGAGDPTRVPDKAGQFYVDTLNRVLYFATGNTAISDWK